MELLKGRYREENFAAMVARSYDYNANAYRSSEKWKILKQLYDRNYLEVTNCDTKIPRKIHQVWLGGTIPPKYKEMADTWREHHPTWKYRLWGDADIKGFKLKNKEFFDKTRNLGQKSDIFRYEILRREGGLYVDTDFECLKPFDDLMHLDFFTGVGYPSEVELYIGIIACVPQHPVISRCVDQMKMNTNADMSSLFNSTGSWYFTKCFFEEINGEKDGCVAFPPLFFYPFPNNVRFSDNAYDYIHPASYAVHHWAVSWANK